MDVFYKIFIKYDEIQITKNKMDFNEYEIKSNRPSYSSDLPSPGVRYSPKQWINYLTNLRLHL